MDTLALEINDAGLVVARDDTVLAVEPGYALAADKEVLTGWPAYRQARLRPQQISNGYWSSLSLEHAEPAIPGSNTAELAFIQLDRLWREFASADSQAVLAVPEYFSAPQLGLLLGLAQEAGIEVRAMVNSAVASAIRPYPERQLVYVDAGLHRVSATVIGQRDEAVQGATSALERIGLGGLMDTFAKRIGEAFVLGTRFDPLHDAGSEQLLYDRLPQWLDELRTAELIHAVVPFGGEEFSVDVPRERVLGAASGFYRAVVQLIAQSRESGGALVVLLSSRLAALPGLENELARLDDTEIVTLDAGHAALAVLARIDDIPAAGGVVKLLKRLPWHAAPLDPPARPRGSERAVQSATKREPQPTHVVYGGVGYRLDNGGLIIGRVRTDGQKVILISEAHSGVSGSHCEIRLRDGELKLTDKSRYGTYVNERRVDGEITLRCADVIRVGSPGAELHVIRLEG